MVTIIPVNSSTRSRWTDHEILRRRKKSSGERFPWLTGVDALVQCGRLYLWGEFKLRVSGLASYLG